MEQKILKTGIVSLDTVFCESAEQPIDIDFTLPDYYADISKILKCRAVSRVVSKSANGNHVLVEGCITATVIYCGSDNCISSYEHQYPFSKRFDTGINVEGCDLTVSSKCEYINCRAVTGRKIDIHGAAGIYVTLTKRRFSDVVSDCDDCNIELLRCNVPATVPMGVAEKYLLVEEEIDLGAGQPDIRCIIRYDADVNITDSKIMAGKSVVKGELIIKLLYAPEGNLSPQMVRYQLPFSQLIELDGINDGCDCESKASIANLEIKPRVSATGECRQFMLAAKLLITSECCCNNDVAVVVDAYSRKYEAEINKSDVNFNKICEQINQNFICKKTIEFSQGALSSVCDIWCDVHTDAVKFDSNSMCVSGVATVFIIAADDTMIPVFYEKTLDFEYLHPMNTYGQFKCLPEISVIGTNYTITGECNMELRIELSICATVYQSSKISLITDIKTNEGKAVAKTNKAAMTVYFASKGEKLWDIAKKYFANVEELKQINESDDEIILSDKMILIPNN